MECNRYIVENYISHKLSKRGFVRGSGHTVRDQSPSLVRRCRGGGAERLLVLGEGVPPSEPLVHRVLRSAGDELERLYQRDMEDMSRQLGLCSAGESSRFSAVLDELFRDGVNWGRIVAFFEFGGTVCVECASREELRAQVDRIVDCMTEYLNGPLSSWMEDNGGWDAFVELYDRHKESILSCYWPSLKTVFGLAALGAASITIGAYLAQK